jgi:hypothetical protein
MHCISCQCCRVGISINTGVHGHVQYYVDCPSILQHVATTVTVFGAVPAG